MRIRGWDFELISNGWVHISAPGEFSITLSPKEWAELIRSLVYLAADRPYLAPT